MRSLQLFLGFEKNEAFRKELNQTNPYLLSLLLDKEDYLKIVTLGKRDFIGKYLSAMPSVEQIEDFEKHILSLLTKIAPRYSFSQNSLRLIPIHGS